MCTSIIMSIYYYLENMFVSLLINTLKRGTMIDLSV